MEKGCRKWKKEEIHELYVEKNYCMDLVSAVTGIPLASLSRLLQSWGYPDEKLEKYGASATSFANEKTRLSAHERGNTDRPPGYCMEEMAEAFFQELQG